MFDYQDKSAVIIFRKHIQNNTNLGGSQTELKKPL